MGHAPKAYSAYGWLSKLGFLFGYPNRCRVIIGTQKGTIILTTTHTTVYSILYYSLL